MSGEILGPIEWVRGITPREATNIGSAVLVAAREEVDSAIALSPSVDLFPEGVSRWREAYLTSSMEWDEKIRTNSGLLETVIDHFQDEDFPQMDIKNVISSEKEARNFRDLLLTGIQEMIENRQIDRCDNTLDSYYWLLKRGLIVGKEKDLSISPKTWTLEDNRDMTAPNYQWDIGIFRTKKDERMIYMIDTLKIARAKLHGAININVTEELIEDRDTSIYDGLKAFTLLRAHSDPKLLRNDGYGELLEDRKKKLTKRFIRECKNDYAGLKKADHTNSNGEYAQRAQSLRRKLKSADDFTKHQRSDVRYYYENRWEHNPNIASVIESFNDLLTATENTDLIRLIIAD